MKKFDIEVLKCLFLVLKYKEEDVVVSLQMVADKENGFNAVLREGSENAKKQVKFKGAPKVLKRAL